MIKHTPEYKSIKKFYGTRCAERSKIPLIRHIDEGLDILEFIGASEDAMRAYALHPLLQDDLDLSNTVENVDLFKFSPRVVLLAMEYRARANDWLSDKVYCFVNSNNKSVPPMFQDGQPSWGVLEEVRDMLVADKVQNYKDFLIHHHGKHERSDELNYYFLQWFKALDVTTDGYQEILCGVPSLLNSAS